LARQIGISPPCSIDGASRRIFRRRLAFSPSGRKGQSTPRLDSDQAAHPAMIAIIVLHSFGSCHGL
jgi:hypothetical protein